jgi:hypothetical protein
MSKVHVYPIHSERPHETDGGGCWCEPRIENLGVDNAGQPARVFVHQGADRVPLAKCLADLNP